ncbi:FecR domain-containing protein [Calycomorphotria hydatis]|uniref:FecR protein n=1 Tax=Calycomorphotria hydatis TaxID=2528027 RepID=A0A517T574_9PLAN|nr:FecR domain-containing protein [Calycomorphotria hydatis]QDT63533.1 FecR protein [Calycomorphotria hydatis]
MSSTPQPTPHQEVLALARSVCDGGLSPADSRRLSELLTSDKTLCQTYLGYLDVHAAMGRLHIDSSSEGIEEFLTSEKPSRPRKEVDAKVLGFAGLAMFVTLSIAVAFLPWKQFFPAESIGHLTTLSNDVEWRSTEKPSGAVLLRGESLSIEKGFVSLTTNQGVVIGLFGPVSVQLTELGLIDLSDGTTTFRVPEAGHGFTVLTPEAKVVDLGTEFLVNRNAEQGTEVTVSKGRVQTSFIDPDGNTLQETELTAGRSLRLYHGFDWIQEAQPSLVWEEKLNQFNSLTDGVAKLEGAARVPAVVSPDLRHGMLQSGNDVLVIPEQVNHFVTDPITWTFRNQRYTIPAGSHVDSYLLHFDPSEVIDSGASATITFHRPILAISGDTEHLQSTDLSFGIPNTMFSEDSLRGLEDDGDRIELSDDQRSITYHPTVFAENRLDQLRVWVLRESLTQ